MYTNEKINLAPNVGKNEEVKIYLVEESSKSDPMLKCYFADLDFKVTSFSSIEQMFGSFTHEIHTVDILLIDSCLVRRENLKKLSALAEKAPEMGIVILSSAEDFNLGDGSVGEAGSFKQPLAFIKKPIWPSRISLILDELFASKKR